MLCSVCQLLNSNIQANSTAEPHLPRKKRQPELAYRTHELLFDYEEGESSDSLETGGSNLGLSLDKGDLDSRARSEERSSGKSRPSPRSRSADSTISRRPRTVALMTQSYPPTSNPRGNPGTPGSGDEGIPKTTEYRSQYVAYPRTEGEAVSTARKSASMGFITPQAAKKDITDKDGDIVTADAWSIRPEEADDDDAALDAVKRGRIKKTEYKAKFKPFSAYTYVDGNWKKSTRLIKDNEMPADADPNQWYTEEVERLKKADMYKVRSHAGVPLYGEEQLPPELIPYVRDLDRTILSPVSVASTSRTWKDERPSKEKTRPAPVGVHRKERKEAVDSPDQPKSREGSTKKKATSESKPAVRPKSAEPVISPLKGEHKSPKHQPRTAGSRPKAPKDLPVHGHGDLSGKKKAPRQGTASPHGRHVDKASPVGSKPRPVPRPAGGLGVMNGEDGKVWLKSEGAGADQPDGREPSKLEPGEEGAVNGMLPPESSVNGYLEGDKAEHMVNGEAEDSVRQKLAEESRDGDIKENGLEPSPRPIIKPPMRVPLTTVKSPEEVTGVRSPDPETWTVPLEIGKGLHWMDGKTPGSAPTGETVDL